MNEQVLTTIMSASSARGINSAPACVSMPIMTSLSTRFLGQPRLTKPTFGRETGKDPAFSGASSMATVGFCGGMESLYSNIHDCLLKHSPSLHAECRAALGAGKYQ